MSILSKIENLKVRFTDSQEAVSEKKELIEKTNHEIALIEDEQKRMQGEWRVLVSLGVEAGICDEAGNAIAANSTAAEPVEEAPAVQAVEDQA